MHLPKKNEERQRIEFYLGGSRSERFAASIFKWVFYFMLLLTLLIEAFLGWLDLIPDIPNERKIKFREFTQRQLKALNEAMKKLQSFFHHHPKDPPPSR